MDGRALIGLSILVNLTASTRVAQLYVWPWLRGLSREAALGILVAPHMFRFFGLSFLIPGIATPDLPYAFATSAAYGDLITAALAASFALSARLSSAIAFVWVFNLFGTADLLHAYYDGMIGNVPPLGSMGATVYIPTVLVPPLLVTHVMVFLMLLRTAPALSRALAAE